MTTAIVPTAPGALAQLGDVEDQARAYVQAAKAANTRRAYAADWRDFTSWCEAAALSALPAAPETVTLYVTARAETSKVSTIQRRLIAISQAHQASRLESPTKSILVRETMKGIRVLDRLSTLLRPELGASHQEQLQCTQTGQCELHSFEFKLFTGRTWVQAPKMTGSPNS